MKRHAFDPTSFLSGLVLGSIALAYLLAERGSWNVDGRWVLPVALIGLGIAGIVGALTGLRGGDTEATPTPSTPAAGARSGGEGPALPLE